MARTIQPGSPLRLKASEATKAIRAGELFDQLWTRSGISPGGRLNSALPILIKNDHSSNLPAYALTRWQGPAMEAATYGGVVPDLILKTASHTTTHPIGVVRDQILAADAGTSTPAGIGMVQVGGIAWALVLGPITSGDRIAPNAAHKGVRATLPSNIEALDTVGSGTTAIIPVRVLSELSCTRQYNVKLWWAPDGGSASFALTYNAITETITINWDDSPTDLKAAVDAHAQFVAQGVACSAVGAGALRYHNCLLTLPDGASISGATHVLTQSDPDEHSPYLSIDLCGC